MNEGGEDEGERTTLTPHEMAEQPLDPTPYEVATRATDAPIADPSQGPTSPQIPVSTLKRRDVSQRRQSNRAEMLYVKIMSCKRDPAGKKLAIRKIIEGFRETLVQGREEIAKQLAEEQAESAAQTARAIEMEADLLVERALRKKNADKATKLRAYLMKVRSGEIAPEKIEC